MEKRASCFENPAPGVAEVRLNRPDKESTRWRGTISRADRGVHHLHEDPGIRAVDSWRRGAGVLFRSGHCGACLKTTGPAARALAATPSCHGAAIYRIENAGCGGGGMALRGESDSPLAMACDLILAQKALLQQPSHQCRAGAGRRRDSSSWRSCWCGACKEYCDGRAAPRRAPRRSTGASSTGVCPRGKLLLDRERARRHRSGAAGHPTYVLGLAKKIVLQRTCSPRLKTVLEIES